MAIVGYARVSTREQATDAQEAELRAAGAQRVFVDHGVSSRLEHRPAWDACLEYLREGDVLVVRALDRLAGSERIAIDVIRDLGKRGVRLRSLSRSWTSTRPRRWGKRSLGSWPCWRNYGCRRFGRIRAGALPMRELRGVLVGDGRGWLGTAWRLLKRCFRRE